ncbi:prenyltransferase [Rhodoferax antarcticus]|uniref:Putative prenyltransferase UbiA n=1 Tax=Rhodoferax antarcticus ANT.BR TaxID=1111071 RepID=A0A1Q8YHQ5_9BURK|nr:prenyltransferase [Rhodoferax antarcticus]APW45179.1 hypothetical protein RA876_00950 [Rhodoferax antarcticus]MCW2310923.1 1,4-dihydroxy-2-naphthoate octaprenyltransferase [Rhodoferax antarcticus]OLP07430.1 putative prenyltransferase UbiA [Rhodoferax antarcticus ANT.BR]
MMPQTPHNLSPATVWQLARPASLTPTGVACVLGTATAAGCGIQLDWAAALAALLLAVGLHAGANLLQAGYAQRGSTAAPTGPFADSGLRLMQDGLVSQAEIRQLAWAVLGMMLAAGLVLSVRAGGGLLLVGFGGVLLAVLFAVPPWRLGTRGLAEVSAVLAWWLVVLGADYVQRHHFFLISVVDAVSFALLVGAVPLVQRQRPGSWVVPALYGLLMVLAYGWLVGGVALLYHPQPALWGLVSLPLSLLAVGLLWGAALRPRWVWLAPWLSVAAALLHGLTMAGGLMTVTMF